MTKAQLTKDLYNYIINDPEFKENVLKQFGIKSTVELGICGKVKTYGFIGMGCGITYLVVDRRSPKAIMLKDVIYDVLRKVNNYIYKNWFTAKDRKYFEDYGCPVMAVLSQDQQIQIEFYHLVVKYAKEILNIKKITYVSNLD